MLALAELTGRFAAHSIWCTSDPNPFVPIVAHEKAGKRGLIRLQAATLEEALAEGKHWLATNPLGVERAVLVYDGYLTLPDRPRTDALVLDAVEYADRPIRMRLGIRYLPGGTALGFKAGSPKVLENEGVSEVDWDPFFARFWIGVKSHPEAAEVWAKHLADGL